MTIPQANMAGGYFDLPVTPSAGPSSVKPSSSSPSNNNGGTAAGAASGITPPVTTPTENTTEQPPAPTSTAAGKARSPGILKSANRVKFHMSNEPQLAPGHVHDGSFMSLPGTPSGLSPDPLPRRPQPAARAHSSDQVPQLADMGSSSTPALATPSLQPAVGASIVDSGSRPASPGIKWEDEHHPEKGRAIHFARERAQRLASHLSRTPSRNSLASPGSLASSREGSPSIPSYPATPSEYGEDIPMISYPEKNTLQFNDDGDDENEDGDGGQAEGKRSANLTSEAHRLVRQMVRKDTDALSRVRAPSPGLMSGQVTPIGEDDPSLYVERPSHYRGGILSSLLKLYDSQQQPSDRGRRATSRPASSRGSTSGDASARGLSPDPQWKANRPRKWYDKSPSQSTTSLTSPVHMLKHSRSFSGGGRRKPQLEDEIRITVHIAETLSRQKYLIRLCRALIRFGAPTHRLEEYLTMSARILEIDMQCLYIPGCMIVSFGDASTHTTDMNLVKSTQGSDLSKLADTHEIYKEVIHDVIGVEEATQRLEEVMHRKKQYSLWMLILLHGCSTATVAPFAFEARPIDMPICFALGCLVAVMQLVFSARSSIYSNIFEITAAVVTSFLARAFGSIEHQGQRLFCFSALAQSSIALILPGYVMLCASLELQSRNLVAGSVRLVYGIIYSLFLGFGITLGTAIYGLLDPNATTEYTCANTNLYPNEYVQHFPFVLIYIFFLSMYNHAKFRQLPVMIGIGMVGYVVNYFAQKRFSAQTQISLPGALATFVIGVLGNLYSRLRHGVAAVAILPAIFVLVPSGLAASGSLVSGIASAEELTKGPNPYSIVTNGTQGFMNNVNMTQGQHSTVVLDIGYGMVQIGIAFTVGLFLAAMVVYPFGKKRSGLFSF